MKFRFPICVWYHNGISTKNFFQNLDWDKKLYYALRTKMSKSDGVMANFEPIWMVGVSHSSI